jgi:hypothetical protein
MKVMQFAGRSFARSLNSTIISALLWVGVVQFSTAGEVRDPTTASASITSGVTPAVRPSPKEVFDAMRNSIRQQYASLKDFTCKEQIERYRGSVRNPRSHKIDVITSQVSYYGDSEHYTNTRQNEKPLNEIGSLSGAWSQGEYGTILHETMMALNSRALKFVSFHDLDGAPAAVYSFNYTATDSPWDISVGGTHYFVPFLCQIWASVANGDVMRIERIAHDVPPSTGISVVNWAAVFSPTSVDGKILWLPAKAIYSVSYLNSDRHDWNQVVFSEYRPFGTTFSKTWVNVKRNSFEILGDIGSNRSQKLIAQLEDVHLALQSLTGARLRKPIRVYAFRSAEEYDLCHPALWSIAFAINLPAEHYIVLGPRAGNQAAAHEYIHAMMHDSFPNLGLWLDEGLASFYSTIELHRGYIQIGAPPEGDLEFLKRFGLPLHIAALVNFHESIKDEQMAQGIYSESWLLVHMLALSSEYRPRFYEFIAALSQGQDPESLFRRLWNRSSDEIEDELRNYLNADHVPTERVKLPKLPNAQGKYIVVNRGDWRPSYNRLLQTLQQYRPT